MTILLRRFLLLAVLGLLFTGSIPTTRAGLTFGVNSVVDVVDAVPGDGICETVPGNRICSLRAAVQETNALQGSDTITVPPGMYLLDSYTYDGDEDAAIGDLDVLDALVVNGAGPGATIIDGNQIDRVFDVPLGAYSLTLNGVTIRNGKATGYPYPNGGGIRNVGTLVVNNSIITGNGADGGGAIYNFNSLTIINSTITHNTAYQGGGIYNLFGGVTILNSTIGDNTAVDGGGLANGGAMHVNRSTITGNTSSQGHGGIANWGVLTLLNTTVSGNTGVVGGGIGNSGYLAISSSTIISNTASQRGGGLYNFMALDSPSSYMKNSIIAGNHAPAGQGSECAGERHFSLGYNLIQDVSDCAIGGDPRGNIVGRDPRLGPLRDNGGPTFTHALLSDSPAIDTANPTGCTDADGNYITEDQRDAIRPRDGNGDGRFFWDIGAFEYGSDPPAPTPTTTPTPTTAPPQNPNSAPSATPTVTLLPTQNPTTQPTAIPTRDPSEPTGGRYVVYVPLMLN